MDRSPDTDFCTLYIGLLCLLGPVAALLLAFAIEFAHVETAFEKMSAQTQHEIEIRADSFELALEGFANFLAVAGDSSDQQLRSYTQRLRQLYPDIYMFEIASRIEHSQRDSFEQSMRTKGYQDFTIHGFDYDARRQLTTLDRRPFYYPIRFIDPESAAANSVLGLDLGSTSSMLIETANRSLAAPRAVASSPFELLEGGMGYVIYRPVGDPDNQLMSAGDPASDQVLDVAMLAIRAQDLLPRWLQNQDRYSLSLSYRGSSAEEPSVALVRSSQRDSDVLWFQDLRTFQHVARLKSRSQPFELTLTKVVVWSDMSLFWLMTVFFSGSFLCFYSARALTQYYVQKSRGQEERLQLYRQANYDLLTGLPNINLLLDRAEQAIRMAQRSARKVGVCYLDIDKFKQINDSRGHQVGDRTLIEIAARLKAVLRAEDTAARIHGDEFVILFPDLDGLQALHQVEMKVRSVFTEAFAISEPPLQVGGSFGIALYPDDAEDLESLLHISDKRMYSDKFTPDVSAAAREPGASPAIENSPSPFQAADGIRTR